MQEANPHNREFFVSLIPKARPPLRNGDLLKIDDLSTINNSKNLLSNRNMHKAKQSLQYSDRSDNEMIDEDDSNENDDSDDSYESQNYSYNSTYNYSSTQIHQRSIHSPNASQSFKDYSKSSLYRAHGQSKNDVPMKHSNISSHICMLFIVITCVLIIGALIIQTASNKHTNQITVKTEMKTKEQHSIEVAKMLDKSMQIIQTQFSNQKPSIWNDIAAAIYDVTLYPKKPSIITLFGKEATTMHCLAKLLGHLSSIALGSNSYLTLMPNDFPNDVGQVIYTLKAKILQKRAVIIQDLLNINTEAIKAFHNFCDKESPLVEHTIYIITMIIDDYKLSQKELEFVEKQLIKRLSGKIEKDILDPLVTRLTDGTIIPILPESNIKFNQTDCSLPVNYRL